MGNYYETFAPPYFLDMSWRFDGLQTNKQAYDRDDAAILSDLQDRFEQLNGIDTSCVQADSHDEVIELAGEVPTEQIKLFLGRVAENILGVRSVENRLVVSRAGASKT